MDEIVQKNLEDLPLDLDDDLFLFRNNGSKVNIWEFYEIHPTRPRKLIPYASWTESQLELKLPDQGKWTRRQDLEVKKDKLVKILYITKTLIAGH